jgi:hypothetical protein
MLARKSIRTQPSQNAKLIFFTRMKEVLQPFTEDSHIFRFARVCELQQIHLHFNFVWLWGRLERMAFSHLTTLNRVDLTFNPLDSIVPSRRIDALNARFGVRAYLATASTG